MNEILEATDTLPPLHPGELLRQEFLVPLGLSAGRVAQACGVPCTRIERIVAEQIGISGDTAIRLGRLFGTTAQFWTNAQSRYELEVAKAAIGSATESIEPFSSAAAA